MAANKSPLVRAAVLLIRLYQHSLSLMIGPCCRFYPTCSQYTLEAIEEWGVCRGVWLGLKRICRCHPLNPGGYDPVPRKNRTCPSAES